MVSVFHYMYSVPSKSSNAIINSTFSPKMSLIGDVKSNDPRGCIMPNLPLVMAAEKGYDLKMKPIECGSTVNWLQVINGTIQWNRDILSKYPGGVECQIKYVVRQDDFHQGLSSKTTTFDSRLSQSIPLEDDYFHADCKTKSTGILESIHHFSNYFASIKAKAEVLARKKEKNSFDTNAGDVAGDSEPKNIPRLNVLVFGFDSISRLNFIRRLPNLYKYLTEQLGAIVLTNHNVVGDGTTAQLLGTFAGVYEDQQPETRRGKSRQTCDVYPFIWKRIKRERYVTAYAEDESSIGTFQYRLNGFKDPPTDHYMRPFHLMIETKDKSSKTYCLGPEPKIKVLMRWCEDVFKAYPPDVTKFVFGFHSEYSHSAISEANLADDPTTEWVTHLNNSGILNNTIMFMMSDHGHRFSVARSSLQGKYEERLPIFSVITPPWFKNIFPNAYRAIKINGAERLTTPFDIHATFQDIMGYINRGMDTPEKHVVTEKWPRGLSILREIPIERTCDDAQIPIHWCACSSWVPVPDYLSDDIAIKAVTTVIDSINNLIKTSNQEPVCEEIKLQKVNRIQKMVPKREMLAFSKSSDHDGRVADLSDTATKVFHNNLSLYLIFMTLIILQQVPEIVYEVQLQTSPGGGIFESTIRYDVSKSSFNLSTKEISRVNKYGFASHCISKTFPHLSKFCYCKKQITKEEMDEEKYMNVIQG